MGEKGLQKWKRQMPAVLAMSLFVSVSIIWALCCGRSLIPSIIHSFALTENRGLIVIQPEGGRGERDVMCNWTSEGVAWPNTLACIVAVCVCVCAGACVFEHEVCLAVCVQLRARYPNVWFTILCCRACGAYLFKSLIMTYEHTHSCSPTERRLCSTLSSHCSQSAVIVESLW